MHRGFARLTAFGVLVIWLGAPSQRVLADNSNQLFVERSYHDLLGQVPDETDLDSYASALDSNAMTTTGVAQSITSGPAFRAVETQQQYAALLHRSADSLSLNGWVSALGSGTTIEQMQANLAGTPEYYTNRGGGTDSGFLTVIYSDLLGRSPSVTERSFGLAELSTESRSNFASGILSELEYDQHLVSGYYPRFLHRAADSMGSAFYSNQLQHGTRDEQVISELVGLPEYSNLPLLPGDSNFDQAVSFTDLLTLAQNYGHTSAHWFNGDFNNDGQVGFGDLLLLAQNYGHTASATSVPEPASLLPVLGASLLMSTARKRK